MITPTRGKEPPRPAETPPFEGGERELLGAGSAYFTQSAAPMYRRAVRRTEGYLVQLTNHHELKNSTNLYRQPKFLKLRLPSCYSAFFLPKTNLRCEALLKKNA